MTLGRSAAATLGLLAALFIILGATQDARQPDPVNGKRIYVSICATCHGDNGEGKESAGGPRIAGQEEWYLKRQLQNFKNGVRGASDADMFGQQMKVSLGPLNAQEMADVIEYLGTIEVNYGVRPPRLPSDKRGAQLYALCGACHGQNGEGNQALNAPKLAGQHTWYVARQIENFKSGLRGTHKDDAYGAQMRPMAMTLADSASVADVALFLQTLTGKAGK